MHLVKGAIMYLTLVAVLYSTNNVWSSVDIKRHGATYETQGQYETGTGRRRGGDPMDIN